MDKKISVKKYLKSPFTADEIKFKKLQSKIFKRNFKWSLRIFILLSFSVFIFSLYYMGVNTDIGYIHKTLILFFDIAFIIFIAFIRAKLVLTFWEFEYFLLYDRVSGYTLNLSPENLEFSEKKFSDAELKKFPHLLKFYKNITKNRQLCLFEEEIILKLMTRDYKY